MAISLFKFILASAAASLSLISAGAAEAGRCEPFEFRDASYLVCTAEPGADDLRLFWRGADGNAYRRFSGIERDLAARGEKLVFAMNAGMYSESYAPVGLYVEGGRQLQPVNTGEVKSPPSQVPNFYKKPNGVFFIGGEGAGIRTTETFLKEGPSDVLLATQSGPMLVIDNRLHPALIPGSSDRTRRSGVGVCEAGRIRFAISEDEVNFHDFAKLFRDGLRCPNALFLDGGRGAGLYDPAMGRNDHSWHGGYGPIFGLVEKVAGD